MRIIIACIFSLIGLAACGGDSRNVDLRQTQTATIPAVDTAAAKVVRVDTMPVLTDTASNDSSRPRRLEKPNLLPPQISFADTILRFGTIAADSVVEHVFEFTNTGGKPLEIAKVEANCGCAVASYPFLPIITGTTREISF